MNYRTVCKSDYLGQWDLEEGKDLIVTISSIEFHESLKVQGVSKVNVFLAKFTDSELKPMVLNSTNMKMLHKLSKSKETDNWHGMTIQLYVDPKVKLMGEEVGGLRIRPFIPKAQKLICQNCNQEIIAAHGMTPAQVEAYTRKQYGKSLCAVCAAELKKKLEEKELNNNENN